MPDCECLPKCPFFNDRMQNMPGMSAVYKKRYCKTDSSKCARYIVFKKLGRDEVPSNLFPNQIEIAQSLIYK